TASAGPENGAVRITEPRIFSCGNRIPRLPQKRLLQAPPARTTWLHRMRPCSVMTPETDPPAVRTPRTPHPSRTGAPRPAAALAIAAVAFPGSATPSLGV